MPRPAWRQTKAAVEKKLPVTSGYHLLEGTAEFVYTGPRLILTVTPRKPSPGNLGPAVSRRRIIHWRFGPEVALIRKVLRYEVDQVAKLMAARRWPVRELYLDRCNLNDTPTDVFLSETCGPCRFPYCELRE